MGLASHVKIVEWVTEGVKLYLREPVLICGAVLCAGTVSFLSLGVLSGPMFGGVFIVLLRLQRVRLQQVSSLMKNSADRPNIGDVFKGLDFLKPTMMFCVPYVIGTLVISAILSAIPLIGWLLNFIAMVCIHSFLMFTIPLIVDQKMEVVLAIKKSVEVVKSGAIEFALFLLLAGAISMSGMLLFGIGVIATIPIFSCALAVAYDDSFFEA